jgi:hypothetical protein
MERVRWLVTLLLALSCTPLSPLREDAGIDAGAAGGTAQGGGFGSAGGSTAGGSGTAGGAGTAGGDVAGGAAGGSADAGRRFFWSSISTPTTVAVQSLFELDGGIFAVSYTGDLLYGDRAGLTTVPDFSFFEAADVYVTPSRKVFVTGNRNNSLVCETGDCTVAVNFVRKGAMTGTDSFLGLCGAGENVYAVATGTSLQGILYRYSASTWQRVSTALDVGNVRSCTVAPNGDVFVVGDTGVSRIVGGGTNPEPVDLGGQPAARWQWLALHFDGGVPGDGLIVGTQGGYRLAQRNADATWTSLAPLQLGTELYRVAPLNPGEFLAVGGSLTAANRYLLITNGVATPLVNQPSSILTVNAMHVVSPDEVFVVGTANGGMRLVMRGVRR